MSRQSKKNEALVTQELLQSLFHYDATTGIFTYKTKNKHRAQQKVGMQAGCVNAHGYRYIKIAGVSYKAARLAFLYVTGYWPTGEVDHINGARDDDRFSNLRDVTSLDNTRNNVRSRSATHGIAVRPGGKYVVGFRVNRKFKYYGVYSSLVAAMDAADKARAELGIYDHVL